MAERLRHFLDCRNKIPNITVTPSETFDDAATMKVSGFAGRLARFLYHTDSVTGVPKGGESPSRGVPGQGNSYNLISGG